MNAKLESLFQNSEKKRRELLRLVENLPESKLFSSPPGKWSISQILSHLIMAEHLSLSYMKKKSLAIEALRNTGLKEEVKFRLLQLSQRVPIKYKAPPVLQETPPQNAPMAQTGEQWDKLRGEFKDFLNGIADKNIHKPIYKHAIAGRLNVQQAIRFFDEHINHHLPQIKRLL